MSNSINWYWSRLKCMSPAEVIYRFRKTAFIQVQQLGIFTANHAPAPVFGKETKSFIQGSNQLQSSRYRQAADDILMGELPIFALQQFEFSPSSDWNLDPRTGKEAPLSFGKTLNYRDGMLYPTNLQFLSNTKVSSNFR